MGLPGPGRLGAGTLAELVELRLVLLQRSGCGNRVWDGDETGDDDSGGEKRLLLHDRLQHSGLVGARDVVRHKRLRGGHRPGVAGHGSGTPPDLFLGRELQGACGQGSDGMSGGAQQGRLVMMTTEKKKKSPQPLEGQKGSQLLLFFFSFAEAKRESAE